MRSENKVGPMFSLSEISSFLGAKRIGNEVTFCGVSTDTRTLVKGNCFVAISGERFDGHDFLEEAEKKGAACAVVSRSVKTSLPLLQVSDTRTGLLQLATLWRQRFRIPVIGVTGSSGKTTVKEMIAALLTQVAKEEEVLVTRGNFNNAIGVPLTLFKLHEKHRFAVIEMGASQPGDLKGLTQVVQPSVAVITNVAPAHLEGFRSLEGVAKAKAEIFEWFKEHEGVAILNADDPFFDYWRHNAPYHRCITFGTSADAQVRAKNIVMDKEGFARFVLQLKSEESSIYCPLPGTHQVHNVLAATAAVLPFEVSLANIQKGLHRVASLSGRMMFCKGVGGARVIDDSYNANLASVRAAIQTLGCFDGEKILVLGDLAELGEKATDIHEQIGKEAKECGISCLLTVGLNSQFASLQFGKNAKHFEHSEPLISYLRPLLNPKVTVLVKGSRSARMERVVQGIRIEER